MTRFARAQGSKASNAKVPEEATPWSNMKEQLQTINEESSTTQQNIETIKSKCQIQKPCTSEWAEFESTSISRAKKGNKKRKTKLPPESHKVDTEHVKKKFKKNSLYPSKVQEAEAQSGTTDIQKKLLLLSKPEPECAKQTKQEKTHVPKKKPIKNRVRKKSHETVMIVEGREIEIELFDRFPVMKEDATRLRELKKKMLNEGIPKDQVAKAMKLERRRAEKALSRERRKLCFHCRGSGHLMSDCPKLTEGSCSICFKCGSTEHKSSQCQVTRSNDFRYGQCFVCGEQGHIARQCPDNPRGLYPQGGSCRICGDVTHLKRDCPQLTEEKKDTGIYLSTNKVMPLEDLGDKEHLKTPIEKVPKKNKIIKF